VTTSPLKIERGGAQPHSEFGGVLLYAPVQKLPGRKEFASAVPGCKKTRSRETTTMPIIQQIPVLRITGKLWLCPTDPPRPCDTYVFQRVRAGLGNVRAVQNRTLQMRRHFIPANPRTPKQQARRFIFERAVNQWQNLPFEERIKWKEMGARRSMPGYNEYIGWVLRYGMI